MNAAQAVWPDSERDVQMLLASVSPNFARILPENLALEFGALACGQSDKELTIAVSEKPSAAAVMRIERATGMQTRVHLVPAHVLAPEIARCYGTLHVRNASVLEDRDEHTLAQYLDRLFERAVLERASDIHIDGLRESTRVRFRIDGRLKLVDTVDTRFSARLTSRLKLLSGLDISERRLPQDGRLSFRFESRSVDVRVASIPSEAGERLALRIFDREGLDLRLDELDFSPEIAADLYRALGGGSGFFVICGPTGSGKSTTLYAMLRELYSEERHLCSVEDPVEKIIPGVTQVPIQPKVGLTFSHALRALLRQDPDVIMVGEIRDAETAVTALNAALSGQCVLSTVHGADIARGIDRLCELGLSRTMLLQSLTGIMTQRLVRKLCTYCRILRSISNSEAVDYGFATNALVYSPQGCDRCNESGYRGRVVLADLALLPQNGTDQQRSSATQERTHAMLLTDARRRCLSGATSIQEIETLFSIARSAL